MEETYSEPVGEAWKYNSDYHQMSALLGVDKHDRDDYELAKKVAYLSDWGGEDISKAYAKINQLRKNLGQNTQGKTLIDNLYNHVRIQQDRQRTAPKPKLNKPRSVSKETPLQKTINQAVQSTVQGAIGGMVQKALGDKRLIQSTVESALKGAIK